MKGRIQISKGGSFNQACSGEESDERLCLRKSIDDKFPSCTNKGGSYECVVDPENDLFQFHMDPTLIRI
jgi:hypothetical protein